jgi:hypothetical protein
VTERPCEATTKTGRRCRSFALPNRPTCISHSPDLAETIRNARRRGGTAAAKIRMLQGRRLRLDTPAALVKFTADLCQDTLSGQVDPNVSRAVSYAIANQLKALELAEASEVRRLLAEVERLTRQARSAS